MRAALVFAVALAVAGCATAGPRGAQGARRVYTALGRAQDLGEAACDRGQVPPPACRAFAAQVAQVMSQGAAYAEALAVDRPAALAALVAAVGEAEGVVARAFPDPPQRAILAALAAARAQALAEAAR